MECITVRFEDFTTINTCDGFLGAIISFIERLPDWIRFGIDLIWF